MSRKLNVMASSVPKFDVAKVLQGIVPEWHIRRIEPRKNLKWDSSMCPVCYRPKEQCWDNGEKKSDLE